MTKRLVLGAWALVAAVWIAGVWFFYEPVDTTQETSRDGAVLEATEEGVTAQKALLALMPPAGTLVTGLAFSWYLSRPKRKQG